jgi:hypothetical protein
VLWLSVSNSALILDLGPSRSLALYLGSLS